MFDNRGHMAVAQNERARVTRFQSLFPFTRATHFGYPFLTQSHMGVGPKMTKGSLFPFRGESCRWSPQLSHVHRTC